VSGKALAANSLAIRPKPQSSFRLENFASHSGRADRLCGTAGSGGNLLVLFAWIGLEAGCGAGTFPMKAEVICKDVHRNFKQPVEAYFW